MLAVLSPAKKLDPTGIPSDLPTTEPRWLDQAGMLIEVARGLDTAGVAELMDLSDKLAALNVNRYHDWRTDHSEGLPAIYQFAGDTYLGLDPRSLDRDTLLWAQDHVAILSGLYGLLRPFDRIHPYRLEMGSRLKNPRGKDLYAFWGERPAKRLNELLEDHEDRTVVNCASDEYFHVVDRAVLSVPVLTPLFQDVDESGNAKTISFYAKRARGSLARAMALNRVSRSDQIRDLQPLGYALHEIRGETWVFRRRQPPVKAR